MAKKDKTKLTGLELNCIEVAVQHEIDTLEDALADPGTGWKSAYKSSEYKSLKERLNTTKSVKNKLWNLGGLIDDLEESHYHVTYDQVTKFTDAYDHSDSDVWIADILNAEVNIPKLRHAIRDPKTYAEGGADVKHIFRKEVKNGTN